MIRKFFIPPVFEKEEDNFRAKFINSYAWLSIFLILLAAPFFLTQATLDLVSFFVTLGALAVMATVIYLLKIRKITASSIVLITTSWLLIGAATAGADGVRGSSVFAYVAIALLASIIISLQAGVIFISLSIIMIWVLALFETSGYIHPNLPSGPTSHALTLSVIFFIIAVLIYFSTNSLRNAIKRASEIEENLRTSNKELQDLNQSLEDRIIGRTFELESANARNEKRAKQFEAIAQIARATTTNEGLETLLPRLATLVSEQFGYYHTGVFIIDEKRENAVLSASNSEGGNRMLQRGHKLQIGQTGIVGYVSATGTPRIALDVGDDAVFFNNPDLPNTHSEMALPLRIEDEIVGVLDIQSTEENAFQEDDIDVLSTLADQVTIAIQNARNYDSMQKLLQQAQRESGVFLEGAWQFLQSDEVSSGYRIAGEKILPINTQLSSAQIKKATQNRSTVSESGDNAVLTIPIRLREDVIGIMNIQSIDEHEWDEDEIDIAEAVAERLSLALETSLLIKSTQRQAEIERITADISGKIGATTQFNTILRTAAEELSRVLGGSEVLVQLRNDELDKNIQDV